MFEFLIEDYTNCKGDCGTEPALRVVTLGGLLEEMLKAMDSPSIRLAVYEIHQRIFDWTLGPPEEDVNRVLDCHSTEDEASHSDMDITVAPHDFQGCLGPLQEKEG